MIEAIIVVCLAAAAAYLLRPLLVGAVVVVVALSAAGAVAAPPDRPSIGLLLLAIDARVDHLRVSEALRISNPGRPRSIELRGGLPPGAEYLTFHRGVESYTRTEGGFAARVHLGTGLSEIAYSYALPTRRAAAIARRFPLDVQRLEVVARGGGTRLRLNRGRAIDPIRLDGESVPRWEVRGLPAGETLTLFLDHLPSSRPWLAPAAAALLAVMLSTGLIGRIRRPREHGEETTRA